MRPFKRNIRLTGMAGAKVFAPTTTKNETLIIAIPWPEFHINTQ
jgi:hypothetical protein